LRKRHGMISTAIEFQKFINPTVINFKTKSITALTNSPTHQLNNSSTDIQHQAPSTYCATSSGSSTVISISVERE
jgi:hypothetical protein